jgi:predicted nucleic acid-binding Zn ribbon protein
MTFKPIGDDIRGLLKEWLDNPETRRVVLQRTWQSAVGETVGRRCRAHHFDDGVLTVQVTDSSWEPQLRSMSRELADKVNDALGGDWVRRIEWVVDGPQDRSGAAPRAGPPERSRRKS